MWIHDGRILSLAYWVGPPSAVPVCSIRKNSVLPASQAATVRRCGSESSRVTGQPGRTDHGRRSSESVSADLVLVAMSAPRSHPPPARPRRPSLAGPRSGGPVRSTPGRPELCGPLNLAPGIVIKSRLAKPINYKLQSAVQHKLRSEELK